MVYVMEKETATYQSQLLQDMVVDAGFFEVDPRAVDHVCDDLRVDVSDLCVRHLGYVACMLRDVMVVS